MNAPKLYTVKEAAKLVGVSTNTLYKYLDENKIKAARGSSVQGRFRIPQSALEEFLGISLSSPNEEVQTVASDSLTDLTADQLTDRPTDTQKNSIADAPVRRNVPVKAARLILLFALLAVLFDLILSPTVSLFTQLSRILFLLCMLLLAYGEGGYRRS